ncbi:MAG: SatD family protein [Acidimicrobiia bacterium]|nr:SatD family protein [Acidimicrobiia bacterium]
MPIAAIIGDIVASRTASSRDALQRTFVDIIATANRTTEPLTPLHITRGDEFEGAYQSIAAAWEATLHLHLLTRANGYQLWLSVAWGEVTALAEADSASVQDGPGWWTARQALTEMKTATRAPKKRRTVFTIDDPTQAALLAAAVALRDEVLAGLDKSDARITLGLLDGRTQASIAEELGVTAPVVSRRAHGNGLLSLAESAKIGL